MAIDIWMVWISREPAINRMDCLSSSFPIDGKRFWICQGMALELSVEWSEKKSKQFKRFLHFEPTAASSWQQPHNKKAVFWSTCDGINKPLAINSSNNHIVYITEMRLWWGQVKSFKSIIDQNDYVIKLITMEMNALNALKVSKACCTQNWNLDVPVDVIILLQRTRMNRLIYLALVAKSVYFYAQRQFKKFNTCSVNPFKI